MLCCGQFLAGRPDVVVATVCTGAPDDAEVTTFDHNSGFASVPSTLKTRLAEDHNAMKVVAGRPRHLGFHDSQYGTPLDVDEVARVVGEELDRCGASLFVFPLGLAHPDHVATRDACLSVASDRPDVDAVVYEELPARVLWPEMVPDALMGLVQAGWCYESAFIGTGERAVKEHTMRMYRSQLWALDWPTFLVPERYWRLSR